MSIEVWYGTCPACTKAGLLFRYQDGVGLCQSCLDDLECCQSSTQGHEKVFWVITVLLLWVALWARAFASFWGP